VKLLTDLRNPQADLTEQAKNIPLFWEYFKKTERKSAVIFFKYVYFLHSPYSDNPYKGLDVVSREEKLKGLFGENLTSNENERQVISLYDEIIRQWLPSLVAFRAARNAMEKLAAFLDGVSFSERDQQGRMVYDPSEVAKIIKDYPALIGSMTELEKAVTAEEYSVTKTRGQKSIGAFEEPN
jgi:hypothetical protein